MASVLEPMFFLIFVNDLRQVINSQLGIYANDTTTYSSFSSKAEV